MATEVHPTAIVYEGTILGEGVKVLEYAVVGKQPVLSPRSTAPRDPLPAARIGDGSVISTGAIVFAGSSIGARVIVGDQACIRERVTLGDDVVVGREKMVVFDDMEPERKVTVYEKSAGPGGELYSGDISIPKVATTEPLREECVHFLELIDGKHDRGKVARDGARVVRALEMLTNSLDA